MRSVGLVEDVLADGWHRPGRRFLMTGFGSEDVIWKSGPFAAAHCMTFPKLLQVSTRNQPYIRTLDGKIVSLRSYSHLQRIFQVNMTGFMERLRHDWSDSGGMARAKVFWRCDGVTLKCAAQNGSWSVVWLNMLFFLKWIFKRKFLTKRGDSNPCAFAREFIDQKKAQQCSTWETSAITVCQTIAFGRFVVVHSAKN